MSGAFAKALPWAMQRLVALMIKATRLRAI